MNSRSRKWKIVLLAAAVLAGILGRFAGHSKASVPPKPPLGHAVTADPPSRTEGRTGTDASSTISSTAAAASAHALPPPGTALAPVFAQLAVRARAGDAAAASRLLADVLRCRQLAASDPLPQGSPRDARAHLRLLERQLERCAAREVCAGLDRGQLAHPQQWAMLAAEAGDPDAREWIATGAFLQQPDVRALELVPRFREMGQEWLEEAAAQGRSNAIAVLAEGHLATPGWGGVVDGVIQPDPVAGLAYLELLHTRHPGEAQQATRTARRIAHLRAALSPAQLAASLRLRDALSAALPSVLHTDGVQSWLQSSSAASGAHAGSLASRCLDSSGQLAWFALRTEIPPARSAAP